MQVEHKTEKGMVLFVKVPDVSGIEKGTLELDLPNGDWQLIGLTSEVTEQQAKMMVDENDESSLPGYGWNDYNGTSVCDDALDSFKSLMQHLQVYEINPYGDVEIKGIAECYKDRWNKYQERTGKWIVLFKPN